VETSLQISWSTLTHYTDSTETSLQISWSTDTLYWLHRNNSLQISWSTLTHYTDSTETSLQISYNVSEWSKISVDCSFRGVRVEQDICRLLFQWSQYNESTDILFHSDTLYWFHWNNSLQISCSTLTHYTDFTETTVYRYLGPLWHIILTPLKQQS
jgi:hypothetical protein